MPWTADQIYTLPNHEIIRFFKSISSISNRLFLVNDFEGVRDEYIREQIFGNKKSQKNYKFQFPPNGLLVVNPIIYSTGYDVNRNEDNFWLNENNESEESWDFIDFDYKENLHLPATISVSESQLKLFALLESLNEETKTPIIYYKCETHGGENLEEYSIVFDKDISIYYFDKRRNKNYAIKNEKTFELESIILQESLYHVGIKLPTSFFALHQTSFDWKRYQIK
jgi:hypothetical protein